MEKNRRQALFLWLFVGLLAGSTLLLAGLQYRWIKEVASSEQERRQRRLEADIDTLRGNLTKKFPPLVLP